MHVVGKDHPDQYVPVMQNGPRWSEIKFIPLSAADSKAREALPCALTRSEVVTIAYEQISPVAHATSEVSRASANLKKLYNPRQGAMIE